MAILSKYSDPVYTSRAADFTRMAISLIQPVTGQAVCYRLYTQFKVGPTQRFSSLQGQNQYPVSWTYGQADGPIKGSFSLIWASWQHALSNFFKGALLNTVFNIQVVTAENNKTVTECYEGCRIRSYSVEASENAEPLSVAVEWEALKAVLGDISLYPADELVELLQINLQLPILNANVA